jgi:dTMP kinase
MNTPPNRSGKLFVVEGIDGSGKSTQIELLHKSVLAEGYDVLVTTWNSSSVVKAITKRGKQKRLLSPATFSLIHAADFASRTYARVLPALRSGAIVLADRYIYTAFARDAVRGVDRDWLRSLYSFAPWPTASFYFDVPVEESLRRIVTSRPRPKYYEAGLDLEFDKDGARSFTIFQGKVRDEYERLVDEFNLIRIDALEPMPAQQRTLRKIVRSQLSLSKPLTA